jgi:hypothetical protein
MEVVNRLGWNLYTRLNRSCIEIEQTVRPTGRPRLHQQSNHLKIHVPVPCVHLRSFLPRPDYSANRSIVGTHAQNSSTSPQKSLTAAASSLFVNRGSSGVIS